MKENKLLNYMGLVQLIHNNKQPNYVYLVLNVLTNKKVKYKWDSYSECYTIDNPNEEVKIKSFEEYYKYYEGSGILPMLEDVYYTDYLNAINYFKLLPKYEQLEKRTIKYKKQIYDRNKKLEGCRSQLGQYVLNNQKLQQQLQSYKDKEDKLREYIKTQKDIVIKQPSRDDEIDQYFIDKFDCLLQILNEGGK